MRNHPICLLIMISLFGPALWAASGFAPSVPDLNLPAEEEEKLISAPAALEPVIEVAQPVPAKTQKQNTSKKKKAAADKKGNAKDAVIAITNEDLKNDLVEVEKVNPKLPPVTTVPVEIPVVQKEQEKKLKEQATGGADTTAGKTTDKTVSDKEASAAAEPQPAVEEPAVAEGENTSQGAVAAQETEVKTEPVKKKKNRVSYNPGTDRDPTLSPDDRLLLKHREEERLRAIEAEKQRKIEAERKRLAELERQRQLELERLRDPSREIRGKIHVNGIIGEEVFIGSKVYGVGDTVLGARIVSVRSDEVVFMYKGQKFTKKVKLQ